MIHYVTGLGVLGAIVLLIGAAFPPKKNEHITEWLFIFGNALMFFYALLNYLHAKGLFFFILLQILVNVGGWLGLAKLKQGVKSKVVGLLGLAMILWSLFLFEDTSNIFFIIGLTLLALGFAFDKGRSKQLLLTIGSSLVAYFSYVVWDPVFLVLNSFFALFAAYYYLKK